MGTPAARVTDAAAATDSENNGPKINSAPSAKAERAADLKLPPLEIRVEELTLSPPEQDFYNCLYKKTKSRFDAFVQSTDKNFLVPVGGAIVASADDTHGTLARTAPRARSEHARASVASAPPPVPLPRGTPASASSWPA